MGVSCFELPAVVQSVSFQTQRPAKSIGGNVDVAQVFELAMIWELAPNTVLGNKCIYSIIIVYPRALLHSG